jgi:biopolymer transport protein ExbB/TolQ
MTLFLGVVLAVCILIHAPLTTAFMANWVFNLLIVCVLLIGIGLTYRQVFVLFPEMRWIAQFRTGHAGLSVLQEPQLLKPLARQLGDDYKRDQFSLSTMSLRTVLDGIHSRMDEQREITRYFISLLVFLGLLGTFWGLLGTINAVGGVITGLDMGKGDFAAVFSELQEGLLTPLQGMGTAFSSSLLGLGGSLILGFLDIQAGHAQNRFYDGLEEWLTGVTNLVGTVDEVEQRGHADLERLREENQALKVQLASKE